MKAAFFCIPAHGHTNPTLGVVRELIARGHEVWYYSYEAMRGKIEPTGAHFIPCDRFDPQTELSEEDGARIGKDLAFSTRLIVNMTLALDDALLNEMRTVAPDVIVGDSMAYWAKLIAGKLQIPFVSSTTTFAFNQESSKVIGQTQKGMFKTLLSMPKINKSLAPLREKGYPVRDVLDIIANNNQTDTVVYTSPEFQPCAETFSARYAFVGPILRPSETTLAPSEQPTVFISLGTVDNKHPDFYRNCLAAFADAPYRVILSVGPSTDISALGDIPENCTVESYVDQMAVLACSDVFLTHCGMNSTSEALYHGIPLGLFPQTPEQNGVANRVHALGAGQLLRSDTADAIRETVDAVLHDASCRAAAQEIAEGFRRCGGAEAAADKIEETASRPAVSMQHEPIMSPLQRMQATTGMLSLLLLPVFLFSHGPARRYFFIACLAFGTLSNILKFLDLHRGKKK